MPGVEMAHSILENIKKLAQLVELKPAPARYVLQLFLDVVSGFAFDFPSRRLC